MLRAGGDVVVVDPRGAGDWPVNEASAGWPLWVHLEGGASWEGDEAAVAEEPTVFFGPGVDDEAAVASLLSRFPEARVVRGDPEAGLPGRVDLSDLGVLPLTTFGGFGSHEGAFRLLAGRGDRVRPVSAVVREVIYLVETRKLGHVLFDDADLSAYGDWLDRFEVELAHLPWRVTWEGSR
ncbi:MAG: hypothetical protein KDA24_09660 [Deltaproteobacteria bacterium]|nr:hypothetical protein [Deltaproteobacteria bacterium]